MHICVFYALVSSPRAARQLQALCETLGWGVLVRNTALCKLETLKPQALQPLAPPSLGRKWASSTTSGRQEGSNDVGAQPKSSYSLVSLEEGVLLQVRPF